MIERSDPGCRFTDQETHAQLFFEHRIKSGNQGQSAERRKYPEQTGQPTAGKSDQRAPELRSQKARQLADAPLAQQLKALLQGTSLPPGDGSEDAIMNESIAQRLAISRPIVWRWSPIA